jgi:hypothetical protein
VLLALKLALVPGLIAAVTLGGRRWGPRVGGWLGALPLVAGPVLLFLSIEQGSAFAARAAEATLAGLVAVAAFALGYAWTAVRRPWPPSLAAGWLAFGVATAALQGVPWQPLTALAAAVAGFGLALAGLPRPPAGAQALAAPRWDLPLRMAAALALVLAVTGLAERLGPRLSGALTPFPVATAILLSFTHAQQGAPAALAFLRGFLPGMWSFALFCFVIALTLEPLGRAPAFAAALAAQLATQAVVLRALRGRRNA